jgi:hypothetical protein
MPSLFIRIGIGIGALLVVLYLKPKMDCPWKDAKCGLGQGGKEPLFKLYLEVKVGLWKVV